MTTADVSNDSAAPAVLDVDDEEWLGQADWIIGGESARKARQQALYAGYLTALFAAVYGFPVIQAIFRTSDRSWLRDQLASPGGVAALVAAIAAVLGTAFWAGHFRGPVVPPLPWIDLVLAAPIDRALALRRWWRFAAVGGAFVGALVGLVFGAGLAFAEVTGVVAIAVATLIGIVVGLVAVRVWLWAQVRSWTGPDRGPSLLWRVPDALRELHSESLRQHSANTSTLAGSAMAGSLRTARLAFARPVRYARTARLRAGRPFPIVVRRDLLGLRREPFSLLVGLGFVTLGAGVLAWSLLQPAAPPVAAAVGLVPLYLGFGAWAEGVRLQADNVGTPSLLGIEAGFEVAAHLVTPVALTAVVGGGVVTLVARLTDAPAGRLVPALVATTAVVALLCGTHLLAAFRGSPRTLTNAQLMVAWYAMPVLIAIILGGILCWATRSAISGRGTGLMVSSWLVALIIAWGFSRVRTLTQQHRT